MLILVFLYVFNFGLLVFMPYVNYIIEKKTLVTIFYYATFDSKVLGSMVTILVVFKFYVGYVFAILLF